MLYISIILIELTLINCSLLKKKVYLALNSFLCQIFNAHKIVIIKRDVFSFKMFYCQITKYKHI